jgi:hypothetical protein
MDLVVVLVVLAVVVLLVSAPLRAGRTHPGTGGRAAQAQESAEHAELEAAKEAKYREIRDLELDYRTGKLSDEDWRAQDRALRVEAVELLRRLDELGQAEGEPTAP